MMKYVKVVFKEHINNFSNIWGMAISDLKKQYSATVLGYGWAVLRNLIFVGAYWFAISIGLKGGSSVDYPYIAWLVCGLGGWFFVKEVLFPAAASIRKYKYLVTKMVYPISTISTFKVISGLIANIMFLPVVMLFCLFSGVEVQWSWIQVFYYQFSLTVLLIGVSWMTSALVVLSRDIEMFINSTVFVLFWLTPILFPISNVSNQLAMILKLNPFFYVIEGYRASFLYGEWFWQSPVLTLYFWGVTVFFLVFGAHVQGKLKPEFADIL